jgi:hypothetical protein
LAFLETLDRGNIYAIVFRLENTMGKERRKAKIASIVEMLGKGKAFHWPDERAAILYPVSRCGEPWPPE